MSKSSILVKPQTKSSLFVSAAGLCCSVGYRLDAALCAFRVNMDHFQESNFTNYSSIPVNVAMLPDEIYGDDRLFQWVEYAVRDCLSRMDDQNSLFDIQRTALIVLAPDGQRPNTKNHEYTEIVKNVLDKLRKEYLHHALIEDSIREYMISLINEGRTGLSTALLRAAQIISNDTANQVLLIGVDSYLNSADINIFLEQKRLFTKGNSDGFIPGEAASAVLLQRGIPSDNGLHIMGIGVAQESGRHDGSEPSRGLGLTMAIRNALEQAKFSPKALEFRISDQNGEHFFANEASNAITRVMFGEHKLTQLTLADKIGEIGAATGPAMLAWLMRDMEDSIYSPGEIGILHLANDNGTRCAVALRYQGD